jgi:hypothetical protein
VEQADAQGVKEVVSSALTKMDTMASSMWSLLSKVHMLVLVFLIIELNILLAL